MPRPVRYLAPVAVAVEPSARTHRAAAHRRVAAFWRVAFRNIARTGPGTHRFRADRSTSDWGDSESGRFYPPVVAPRNCGLYLQTAMSGMWDSDAPHRLAAHGVRWL